MSEDELKELQQALELDQYIEQVRLQRSARLPANLTPEQRRTSGMVLYFHTASPRVADPRPDFRAELRQRLFQQGQAGDNVQTDADIALAPTTTLTPLPQLKEGQSRRIYQHPQAPQPAVLPSARPNSTPGKKHNQPGTRKGLGPLPRRALLAGVPIAASLLAGVAIGATAEHLSQPQPPSPVPHPALREHDPGTWTWQPVALLDQLGTEPIRFTTATITGFVIRQTKNIDKEQIVAFSGACPHLGCLVQWQNNAREFLCPCHERRFDTAGDPVHPGNDVPNNTAMPSLETKIEQGHIYVKVPPGK